MENTGERHILGIDFIDGADYYIHLLHIASYEFALNYVKGKKVLDYGCGSGYGAYMLAKEAENVVATDLSDEAVSYSMEKFVSNNLIFKKIEDIDYQKFDVIVSFQVIEHVKNDKKYIKKLKDMLNPGGVLLITTPDRTDRLFRYIQKPWNVYHLKEYSANSISKLLSKYFNEFDVLKISSHTELVLPEIIRRKKQRFISLPCTLFFYPNFLRVFLLKFQIKLYKLYKLLTSSGQRNNQSQKLQEMVQEKSSFLKFSSKDIEISKNPKYFTDLFVICKS
ncbi:MAG: class I SAM-dependent methyltransferase [Bacteroidales bacterium]|jgi:SAM-dependent methyltransferase|nr:class I SAM-dependent methyltransferase [Bacteroidales bacterium]